MESREVGRRHRVFVGAAGTGTGFGVVSSLRAHWFDSVEIVVSDINPPHLVAAAGLADAAVQSPYASDESFVVWLERELTTRNISTYLPILDEEIVIAARLRAEGRLPACTTVFAPSEESAEICFDKFRTNAWLAAHAIPTPRTGTVSDFAGWPLSDLIAKPRAGRGSVGFRLLDDGANGPGEGEGMLFQERCSAPELTLDCFHSAETSACRVVCRERLETKAGVCTKARIFDDDALAQLAEEVGRGLGLFGAFCIQVMRSRTSDAWLVTDVNPRPGAGFRMSAACGVDTVAAAFADAWGEDPSRFLPLVETPRTVVRVYQEVVT